MLGCVYHSKPKKPKPAMTIEQEERRTRVIRVIECAANVDRTPTRIKENASTLNYITPHFRAEATLEMAPLKEGEIYTVGWVQAVTDMKFFNEYPSGGTSSWEIQELNSGRSSAVSDADGRQYPWYGVTTERETVKGPCSGWQRLKVTMNDNFSPTVSWAIPVGRDQPDTLHSIHRDQSFVAWLVLKNEISGEIQVVRAYSWRAVINIAVDCSRRVGERAKLLDPVYQDQPRELEAYPLPKTALSAPRANEAQKFVWRTIDSELIFEVSCTPAMSPASSVASLQPSGLSEARYPIRYAPY